jgi:hypothetical protein
LLVLVAARGAGRRLIPWVAWAGVAMTLFLFGSGYHSVIPARLLSEEPFTVQAIRASAPAGPFRVLQWDSIRVHANVAVHRGWWPQDEHGYRQYIAALPGNYNLVWGLSSVRQEEWSALPLRHTRSLTSAILAKGDRDGFPAVAPYLPWWNAAYVISQRPLQDASLTELAADRTHLYRAQMQGKRAWIVHEVTVERDESRLMQRLATHPEGLTRSIALVASDPLLPPASTRQADAQRQTTNVRVDAGSGREPSAESARITSHSSTRVRMEATAARAGHVVLGESWAPGWRAWIDGRPAPILRANAVHRAVQVGPGRHHVEFRYEPADFRLGLYLTAAALALVVALATAASGARR